MRSSSPNGPATFSPASSGSSHAFNLGDAEALLRIGEHLFAANRENHYAWGMYAFGLEECNRIDEAEAHARRAIEMQRKDPWAHHALAHCLEARGRSRALHSCSRSATRGRTATPSCTPTIGGTSRFS